MLKERDIEDFTQEYEAHLKRKEKARTVITADKAHCSTDNNFMSVTFDMQRVLQIPSSPASLMSYYSCTLYVYDLCVYNLAMPNDASCYCCQKLKGRCGSNEIATCIYDWIYQLPSMVFEVSLFFDTCGG